MAKPRKIESADSLLRTIIPECKAIPPELYNLELIWYISEQVYKDVVQTKENYIICSDQGK